MNISKKLILATISLAFMIQLKPMELLACSKETIKYKAFGPEKLSAHLNKLFDEQTKELNELESYKLAKKFIKEQSININEKDANGNTALHFAAQNGCNEVIKLLASLGADINAKAKELIQIKWEDIQDDPLIKERNITKEIFTYDHGSNMFFAKFIIKGYLSRTNRKACAFKDIFKVSEEEEIGSLQETDTIQITIHECTPLHDAICNNKIETVKLLIELGANVNQPIKHTFALLAIIPQCGCAIISYTTIINPKNIANNWDFKNIEKLIEANKGISRQDYETSDQGLT